MLWFTRMKLPALWRLGETGDSFLSGELWICAVPSPGSKLPNSEDERQCFDLKSPGRVPSDRSSLNRDGEAGILE